MRIQPGGSALQCPSSTCRCSSACCAVLHAAAAGPSEGASSHACRSVGACAVPPRTTRLASARLRLPPRNVAPAASAASKSGRCKGHSQALRSSWPAVAIASASRGAAAIARSWSRSICSNTTQVGTPSASSRRSSVARRRWCAGLSWISPSRTRCFERSRWAHILECDRATRQIHRSVCQRVGSRDPVRRAGTRQRVGGAADAGHRHQRHRQRPTPGQSHRAQPAAYLTLQPYGAAVGVLTDLPASESVSAARTKFFASLTSAGSADRLSSMPPA